MAYDRKQIDDLRHALDQTLTFYDKPLAPASWSFWWAALQNLPPDAVMQALRDYIKEGKYAPRPANIVELARAASSNIPSHQDHTSAREFKRPPTDIAEAWMWYLALTSKGTPVEMFPEKLKISEELAERNLHIVNEQACKLKQYESVLPEHRLKEYYGEGLTPTF